MRLKLPSGAFSASLPFSVISNAAILQSIQPGSGAQGLNPATVTFSVANVRPPYDGVKVVFSAQPNVLIATSGTSSPFTAQIDLRGLDTGVYTLQVKNPNGAALSNPSNFTVTPGRPTLASVTPSTAAQQVALVPVTITGTNFAKPDVAGNNGSAIHFFANCTPVVNGSGQVTGCTCTGTTPCLNNLTSQVLGPPYSQVTVTSSTRIDVQLDTTSALPLTYGFWIQNPGGSPSPQFSNVLLNAFTVTP